MGSSNNELRFVIILLWFISTNQLMGLSRADKHPIQPLMLQQRFKVPSIEERVKLQEDLLKPGYYLVYDQYTGAGCPVPQELFKGSTFISAKKHFEENKSPDNKSDIKSIELPFPIKIIAKTFSLLELTSGSKNPDYYYVLDFCKKIRKDLSPRECQEIIDIIKYLDISVTHHRWLVYEKGTSDIFVTPINEENSSIVNGILEINYPMSLFKMLNFRGFKKKVRLTEICLLNIKEQEKIAKISTEVFNEISLLDVKFIIQELYHKRNDSFRTCLQDIKAAINQKAIIMISNWVLAGFSAIKNALREEGASIIVYYKTVFFRDAYFLEEISKVADSDVWPLYKDQRLAEDFEKQKSFIDKFHIAGIKDLKEKPTLHAFITSFKDMIHFELEVKEKRDEALRGSGLKYLIINAWDRFWNFIK